MQQDMEQLFPIYGDSYWETVRKYLEKVDMTHQEFSDKTGLNRSQITKAINKSSTPHSKTRSKIESGLNLYVKKNNKGRWVMFNYETVADLEGGEVMLYYNRIENLGYFFKEMQELKDTFEKVNRALNLEDSEKEIMFTGLTEKIHRLYAKCFK
jgi:transcriptional regulator with XRE-family HTH domain